MEDGVSRRKFLEVSARFTGAAGLWKAIAPWIGTGVSLTAAGCVARRSEQDMLERLVFGIATDVRSFDPAFIVMALDGFVSCNIHEPLTWYDRVPTLIPRLALSWEPERGGRDWLFRLRPNVHFHDGAPFNASAVKAHFERIKNPAVKSNRVGRVAKLDRVEELDELTVRFCLTVPFSMWPDQVRNGWSAFVSPKRIAECVKPEDYTNKPVGTGPFRFVEYVPDSVIRLERNPDYWDASRISVKSLEFRPVREPTTRLIQVEQNLIDVAPMAFPHVAVAQRDKSMKLARLPFLATTYAGLNCMKPPFDDVRVRRAVNFAVDREKIVRTVFCGVGTAAGGPIPRVMPSFNRKAERYGYDPDAARALLKEAGLAPGTKVSLWSTERSEEKILCELLKDQLGAVGFDVDPVIIDQQGYWGKFDKYQKRDPQGNPLWEPRAPGVFDMFIAGWVGGETAWGYIDPLFRSSSTSNSSFYKNAAVDKMLDDLLAETSEAKREVLIQSLQETVVNDAPWIFLIDRETVMSVRRHVDGWSPHPAGEYEFQGVNLVATDGRQ